MPEKFLTDDERLLVLGALDSLGVALSEARHKWTEGERAIYEQAVTLLGGDPAPE